MALAMRERVDELAIKWHKHGHDLHFGVGIAQGYATIGAIGFEGRWDYGAIGTVSNLAARLCSEAKPGQVLISQRVLASVEELSMLGLEQARDTILPQVLVRERFRPYVEDELDPMFEGHVRLLAHPAAQERAPQPDGRVVIAIGPEGGWVPFEIDLLQAHGFTPFTLGPRTLRVEVAVPYALGAISRSRINP